MIPPLLAGLVNFPNGLVGGLNSLEGEVVISPLLAGGAKSFLMNGHSCPGVLLDASYFKNNY